MSMQKIAKRTGVSSATISRAFSQPEKLRPETLERIRKLCDELNYRPRVIPNNLSTVTVIVPDDGLVELADGIILSNLVSELNRHNMPTIVATMQSLKSRPTIFQKAFIAILRNIGDEDAQLLRQYADVGPFITIHDTHGDIGPNAVRLSSDHRGAILNALAHLEERGHERIAYICRRIEAKGYVQRLETYQERMTDRELFDPALLYRNDEQYLFDGLRRVCDAKPTAMIVGDTLLTQRVLHYLKILGKVVPDDISMMSMEYAGGIPHLFPPITGIVQPLEGLGRTAGRLMIQTLRQSDEPISPVQRLPYQLVDRESVRLAQA